METPEEVPVEDPATDDDVGGDEDDSAGEDEAPAVE
jgi:hypothetical protein